MKTKSIIVMPLTLLLLLNLSFISGSKLPSSPSSLAKATMTKNEITKVESQDDLEGAETIVVNSWDDYAYRKAWPWNNYGYGNRRPPYNPHRRPSYHYPQRPMIHFGSRPSFSRPSYHNRG